MNQTTVQKSNTLRFGSAKVEISQDGTDWTDLGVANKISFEEKFSLVEIKADNGGLVCALIKDQECTVKFNLLEIDLETLSTLRGGIDIYDDSATPCLTSGGLVTITSNMVRLTNKNAAGQDFVITVHKAVNQDGIKIDLPADDDPKLWEVPITLKGTRDASKSAGEQLFTIVDNQTGEAEEEQQEE